MLYYEQGVVTAREASSGNATGRRQFTPLLIRKRIDKSSPLIFKALCTNQVIEAKFKFFRPSPAGDGNTQQFFTVEIKQGRVASAKQILPNTLVPATSHEPPMEEVTFVFHTITQTYEDGGVTHEEHLERADVICAEQEFDAQASNLPTTEVPQRVSR